jgi:hypothetical protein
MICIPSDYFTLCKIHRKVFQLSVIGYVLSAICPLTTHNGQPNRYGCALTKRHLIKEGFFSGIRKGWDGFIWMMKILVPISLLTASLEWSGWIRHVDFLVQPVMKLLYLPPSAALPLLIGALSGIYGGIASMAVLPFSMEQMTLMAIFILIFHNVLQEGIIQGKSGIHPLKATLFRLVSAILMVIFAAQFLQSVSGGSLSEGSPFISQETFAHMVRSWALTMLQLALRVFLIIMSLLTVMEILISLGWIDRIISFLAPLFGVFGLSTKAGIIWITALFFGLTYGAAIIVKEAENGNLSREELERLHVSIGINHSIIEDPSLFLALGLGPFWLWVPRMAAAILAVQLLKLIHAATGKETSSTKSH